MGVINTGLCLYGPKDIKRALLKDPSLFSLVLSNLLAIPLALIFNWNIMIILWAYWSQSVTIGFFNFLRIRSLKQPLIKKPKIGEKQFMFNNVFMALFFAVHYGAFHFVYAVFLMTFATWGLGANVTPIFSVIGRPQPTNTIYVLLMAGIFFTNHLFSFIYNRKQDEKKQNIKRLFFFPYARIIPMHVTIIFGFGFLSIIGWNVGFVLVLFLFLKTIADAVMHVIEHA